VCDGDIDFNVDVVVANDDLVVYDNVVLNDVVRLTI